MTKPICFNWSTAVRKVSTDLLKKAVSWARGAQQAVCMSSNNTADLLKCAELLQCSSAVTSFKGHNYVPYWKIGIFTIEEILNST